MRLLVSPLILDVCLLCTNFYLFWNHREIWRVQINWPFWRSLLFSTKNCYGYMWNLYSKRSEWNSVQLKIGFEFNCNQTISSSVILSSIAFLAAVQVVVYMPNANNHMCTPWTWRVDIGTKHHTHIQMYTFQYYVVKWSVSRLNLVLNLSVQVNRNFVPLRIVCFCVSIFLHLFRLSIWSSLIFRLFIIYRHMFLLVSGNSSSARASGSRFNIHTKIHNNKI